MINDPRRRWRRVLGTGFEGRSVVPSKVQVHLAIHFIAVAPFVIAEAAGITDVKHHVRFGTQLLQDGIEAIGWPVEQVTDAVNRDTVWPASKALVSVSKLPLE